MTELSDAIVRGDKLEGIAGLSRALLAAAATNFHLSICREPSIEECGDCSWALKGLTNAVAAAAPVIEEEAREGERQKAGDLLMGAWGVIANASEGAWDTESDAWREAAVRWRDAFHAWLDEHAPPVAAAVEPTEVPDREEAQESKT